MKNFRQLLSALLSLVLCLSLVTPAFAVETTEGEETPCTSPLHHATEGHRRKWTVYDSPRDAAGNILTDENKQPLWDDIQLQFNWRNGKGEPAEGKFTRSWFNAPTAHHEGGATYTLVGFIDDSGNIYSGTQSGSRFNFTPRIEIPGVTNACVELNFYTCWKVEKPEPTCKDPLHDTVNNKHQSKLVVYDSALDENGAVLPGADGNPLWEETVCYEAKGYATASTKNQLVLPQKFSPRKIDGVKYTLAGLLNKATGEYLSCSFSGRTCTISGKVEIPGNKNGCAVNEYYTCWKVEKPACNHPLHDTKNDKHRTSIVFIDSALDANGAPLKGVNGEEIKWYQEYGFSSWESSSGGNKHDIQDFTSGSITHNSQGYKFNFLGWFDESGNVASGSWDGGKFCFDAPISVPVDPNKCQEYRYYARWQAVKSPVLHAYCVDVVAQGSGLWENPNGTADGYTHTFDDPSSDSLAGSYQFLGWIAEENIASGAPLYQPGQQVTIDLTQYESGSEHTVKYYAVWQPSLTVNLYNDGTLYETYTSLTNGYTANLAQKVPAKEGNLFLGWYDESGTKIDQANFTLPELAITDRVAPKVVNLYANWLLQEEISLSVADASAVYNGVAQTGATAVTATGLKEGHTLQSVTGYTPATGTNVADPYTGSFAADTSVVIVDSTGADVSGEYKVASMVPGKLTITPATLTITTPSDSKPFDTSALTAGPATIDGLVNGETATVTATGAQTVVGSSVNNYSLTWGTAVASNYTIREVLGTLTVNASSYVPPYVPGGGGGEQLDIQDEEVPLASAIGLNTEDHFAYIAGYTDGTVRPENNITRAEVATIFFRLLTDESRTIYWSQENDYSDVDAEKWYNNAVSTLSNMGVLTGYPDGTFRPDAPITRAEFCTIAVSFFDYEDIVYDGTFSDVADGEWWTEYIAAAVELDLVSGYPDGTFRPQENILRAEACAIVNRVLERKPHVAHLLPEEEMITWPDNDDESAWYYAHMQEATNSHDYDFIGADELHDHEDAEQWTEKLPERDWAALEREWAEANAAPGGEVIG